MTATFRSPSRPSRPLVTAVRAGLCLFLALAATARGADPPAPADEVLKLVPAEAGVVLAVDDLRGRWREIADSPLAKNVRALPAFQTWLNSKNAADFSRARDEVMTFLQTSPEQVRDEVLGDSVVLAIILPEDRSLDPSGARGLLALKARDPALLKRLVEQLNQGQLQEGELAEVVEERHADVAYFTRKHPKGSPEPPESYVLFPDGAFAFSNEAALIRDVIDRKAGRKAGTSFADAEGFAKASKALAPRPLARAFVSSDFALRILSSLPPETDPEGKRILEIFRGYLSSVSATGAALSLEDAQAQLQVVQSFRPGALAPEGDSTPAPPRLALPDSAVAAASIRVDAPALYRLLAGMVPAKDQAKLAKLEAIAGALLLGQDLRERILPALGPEVVAYIDAADAPSSPRSPGPGTDQPFRFVASVELQEREGEGEVSAALALDNALKGVLTALSLDESRVPATASVVTRDGVTSLNAPYPFAFAVDAQKGRLTLGSSPAAVAHRLEADARDEAGGRFRGFQAAAFPDCTSFACVDLATAADLAARHKDRLIAAAARRQRRKPDDVARDFDQILEVAKLFDAAYVCSRVDAPEDLLEYRIGLLAGGVKAPAP